jgi:tetratricopeptide (TPR) repeat protein
LPPLATAGGRSQSPPLEELIDAAFRAERDGQYQKAADLFSEAIKRKPSDLLREHLAYCCSATGNLVAARIQLQLLVAKDKQNARLENNLGYVLMRTQDYDRAAARFEKAIELDPALFQPYFNRALCYLRSGNVTPEAARYIERAIDLSPIKHHRLHFVAGQIWRVLEQSSSDQPGATERRSLYHINAAIALGAPRNKLLSDCQFPSDHTGGDNAQNSDEILDSLHLHYCLPMVWTSDE